MCVYMIFEVNSETNYTCLRTPVLRKLFQKFKVPAMTTFLLVLLTKFWSAMTSDELMSSFLLPVLSATRSYSALLAGKNGHDAGQRLCCCSCQNQTRTTSRCWNTLPTALTWLQQTISCFPGRRMTFQAFTWPVTASGTNWNGSFVTSPKTTSPRHSRGGYTTTKSVSKLPVDMLRKAKKMFFYL